MITAVDFREDAGFAALGASGLIHVWVQVDDGDPFKLFSYFNDELAFTTEELVGLTVEEARTLHLVRDVNYLTTP